MVHQMRHCDQMVSRIEQAGSVEQPRLWWYLCPYIHSRCQSHLLSRIKKNAVYAGMTTSSYDANTIRHLTPKAVLCVYLNTCYHAMQHLSSPRGSKAASLLSVDVVNQMVKDAALTCSLAQKRVHSILVVRKIASTHVNLA